MLRLSGYPGKVAFLYLDVVTNKIAMSFMQCLFLNGITGYFWLIILTIFM